MTRTLTVATWNIFGGRVWDGSRVDLELTLATLRRLDADLVAVQEVDREQGRSHRADQARLLGEALGMDWRYAPAMLGTPGEGWRVPVPSDPDPGGTAYGIALLSRLSPSRSRPSCCPRPAATSPGRPGGRPRRRRPAPDRRRHHLSFVPGPNLTQLRALQHHLDELGAPACSWATSTCGGRPCGCCRAGVAAAGPRGTFRNRPPGSSAPLVQIDHVLAADARASLHVRRGRIVSGLASDHRAVVVELDWS